jgi:hypothetical protein
MANKKINVAELDFDGIKKNLKTFLQGQSEFQDYDFEGSGLAVLLDVLAYNTHYNALYNNLTINEMFLDSASKRNSVVSLAKMLGYVPRSCACARARLRLTVNNGITGPSSLTLPANSAFSSQVDGVQYNFYTTTQYTITGSGTSYTFDNIEVIEGTPLSFQWEYSPGSRYIIPNPNIDLSTLKVKVQESANSTKYDTFTSSSTITTADSTTKVYFIKEIDDGLYELTFGDGVIGRALDAGNVIHVEYMASSLDAPNGARIFNYNGQTLINSATNVVTCLAYAAGGSSAEDIESIRFNAPRMYATQNRAVTPDDYKAIIYSAFPDAQSVSVWGGEDNNPPVYGKIFVCVKPKDATKLTQLQKANLLSTVLSSKNVVSVTPELVDPDFINISLKVNVYYNPRETTRTAPEIASLVTQTIFDYDDTDLQRFDGVFRFSKVSRLIDTTEDAITNNIMTVLLRRNIAARYNVSAQYLLNLINPIAYSETPGGSISTTGFYISGSDEIHYIDDYKTNLRLFKYGTNAEKIVVNDQIGTIDHDNGILDVRNLNVAALADIDWEWTVKPRSNDVVSALTQIAKIARDHLYVTAIPDNSASGDLRAGYNYTFSNSSAEVLGDKVGNSSDLINNQ